MARTWSQKLRTAQEQGKRVVISPEPHAGLEVEYAPRYPTDREPWVPKKPTGCRYSGRECHVEE